MHKLYDLKEKLIRELEDYAEHSKFSREDVEAIKYAASAVDHICNIMDHADGEYEYSETGMMPRYGYEDHSYMRRSYAGPTRDRRGRYSRASEDVAEKLREIMHDAHDDSIRMEIEHLANKVEKM